MNLDCEPDVLLALPGTPGPALSALWRLLSGPEKAALLPHLLGGTSSEWLAATLHAAGYQLSSTSIKKYRRELR